MANIGSIKIPDPPLHADPSLRQWMASIHQVVLGLQSASSTPQPVQALKVTPVSGGNVVAFTRSQASNFRVYHSTTPDFADAQAADIGTNNQWTDQVGAGAVKKWYWVVAQNQGQSSTVAGPVTGTTLAPGSSAVVTPPADQSFVTVHDTTLNIDRPAIWPTDRVASPRTTPLP